MLNFYNKNIPVRGKLAGIQHYKHWLLVGLLAFHSTTDEQY